jgi:hypothetical protein
MAEQTADCSRLVLMSASIDPATADVARKLALGECR